MAWHRHLRRSSVLQHTDLHPGNILVRLRQSGSDKEGKAATVSNIDDVLLRPIAKGQARAQLQLVSSILQLLQKSEALLSSTPRDWGYFVQLA